MVDGRERQKGIPVHRRPDSSGQWIKIMARAGRLDSVSLCVFLFVGKIFSCHTSYKRKFEQYIIKADSHPVMNLGSWENKVNLWRERCLGMALKT